MEKLVKCIKNYENKTKLLLLEEIEKEIEPWMIDDDFRSLIVKLKEKYKLEN